MDTIIALFGGRLKWSTYAQAQVRAAYPWSHAVELRISRQAVSYFVPNHDKLELSRDLLVISLSVLIQL